MSENTNKTPLKKIKTSRIFYPILIGLGVVGYMLYDEFDITSFNTINFTITTAIWILIAALMMGLRDFGYMLRFRILTGKELSWKQCFNIIMLWEFTSAVAPAALGGTSIAVYYVHKEGISGGRSTALVMAASFLDELYFIIIFPIVFLLIGSKLFAVGGELSFANKFFYFAFIGYLIKLGFVALVGYGLFINPRGMKGLLLRIFKIRFLRKKRYSMLKIGNDLIENSRILKQQPFSFWLKSFGATVFAWTARYWVVNALLLAFFLGYDHEHFLIFARQVMMWIMMLVSPTPGGSGFAEFIFTKYLSEFIPIGGIAIAMAFLWRLISYYPYLFIGVIIIPRWIKKKFGEDNQPQNQADIEKTKLKETI